MRKVTAVLILLYANLAWADPPTLEIPPEVKPNGQYVRVVPKGDSVAVSYVGLDNVDPIPSDALRDVRMFLLDTSRLAVGRYRFAAVGAGKTGEQTRTDFSVVIGEPPPGPGPGPNPPVPPNPDPFQKKKDPFLSSGVPPGFRVMTVYDDDKRKDYPDAQRQILYSQLVMGYYRDHCIKGPNGAPDSRNLPIGIDLSEEDPMWAKVMALPRKSDPWVYIGNGKTGYSGPLPANVDDMLTLLKKYGG